LKLKSIEDFRQLFFLLYLQKPFIKCSTTEIPDRYTLF